MLQGNAHVSAHSSVSVLTQDHLTFFRAARRASLQDAYHTLAQLTDWTGPLEESVTLKVIWYTTLCDGDKLDVSPDSSLEAGSLMLTHGGD